MSDNVVLSKHFDSLASAIQRCLSAGYAPTAYIPAGESSVLDTMPSTTDGGMWYELEGNVPVIKMHLKNWDLKVNETPLLDSQLVVDLYAGGERLDGYIFKDLAGGTWNFEGTPSSNPDTSIGLYPYVKSEYRAQAKGTDYYVRPFIFDSSSKYLVRSGDFILGDRFTIGFWYASFNAGTLMRFYTSDSTEFFTISLQNDSSATSMIKFGFNLSGITYTTDSIPSFNDGSCSHFEINYNDGTLLFFNNGQFVSSVSASFPKTTFSRLVLGSLSAADGSSCFGDLKIYKDIVLHSSAETSFTPTYLPRLID